MRNEKCSSAENLGKIICRTIWLEYSCVPSVASGKAEYSFLIPRKKTKIMKKQRIIELAVKVIVAALTAFLTALGTTSCMRVL